MDNRVMCIWKEEVWYPYIQGSSKSALLLDAMESHIHSNFIDTVYEKGTKVIQIPRGFTPVCHPRDEGIMKPFKMQLAEMCQSRKISKYSNMGGIGKIPTPVRTDILNWLNKIWNEFSAETIKNSFRKCGFTDYVNLNIETVLEMI